MSTTPHLICGHTTLEWSVSVCASSPNYRGSIARTRGIALAKKGFRGVFTFDQDIVRHRIVITEGSSWR